jgi:hypothetical protein
MSQPEPHRPPRHYSRRDVLRSGLLLLGGAALTRLPDLVGAAGSVPDPRAALFQGERAFAHAAAQMQWVPRHPGTEGARRCGDYILAELAAAGWATEEQPFTYRDTPCRNLIGTRGSGPPLIIGAHYDTRRLADEDPDPANRTQPVPGANDGASGIAVLLELARVLRPETLGRTIWLVAFDAEDNGELDGWDWIVGAQYMADNLTTLPQGMVLVDMIGDADLQIYYEYNSSTVLNEAIWEVAADEGHTAFIPEYRWSILDDHIPFRRLGIPAANLIDFDYPYWHTVEDTLDKISAASLEAVGRTLHAWLLRGAPGLPSASASTTIHLPTVPQGAHTVRAFDNLPNRTRRQT